MLKTFSQLKITYKFKPRVDNFVFKLHYKATNLLFFLCALLTTLYDVVGQYLCELNYICAEMYIGLSIFFQINF